MQHVNVLFVNTFFQGPVVPCCILAPRETYLAALSIGLMWHRCFEADLSLAAVLLVFF